MTNITATLPTMWGDLIYESDVQQDARFVNMSENEWKALVKRHLASCQDLKRAMAWIEHIESKRIKTTEEEEPEPEYAADLRLFRDMIMEPSKYGDDIDMVLDIEQKLLNGPARWRVAAAWAEDENRPEFMEPAPRDLAIRRIQALVRGVLARKNAPSMDCSNCLAHAPSYPTPSGKKVCDECLHEGEWLQCQGCGYAMHVDDRDEYRPGYWCSRECAYF